MKHKHLKTIVIILLNILFCAITIRLFLRNSILRPFTGNLLKETISALLLLGSLYANYFLFYPRIYKKYSYFIYWGTVVILAIVVGMADLAIAYPNIVSLNPQLIQQVGYYNFFSTILYFTIGRNLALNFFPYLLRERQHLRHSLEREREIVYERVRMLDVTDKDSNIHLVSIDEIFYCQQQRNFTMVYTVQNKSYTRLGSMKHLAQLLGKDEFIRISACVLLPFQYVKSCDGNMVVMERMPWEEDFTTFKLYHKFDEEIADKILAGISKHSDAAIPQKTGRKTIRRKPITPPDEKIWKVLSCIERHQYCNSSDIVSDTQYSHSTVERCIAELRKQGLIEHSGSKKNGGYHLLK